MSLEKLQKYKKYKIGRLGVILFLSIALIAFVFGNKKGAVDSISVLSVDRIFIVQGQKGSDLNKYYKDFNFSDRIKLIFSTKYVFPVSGSIKLNEDDFLRKYSLHFVMNKDTAIYYVDLDNAMVVTNRFSGVYKSDSMLETINDIVQTPR